MHRILWISALITLLSITTTFATDELKELKGAEGGEQEFAGKKLAAVLFDNAERLVAGFSKEAGKDAVEPKQRIDLGFSLLEKNPVYQALPQRGRMTARHSLASLYDKYIPSPTEFSRKTPKKINEEANKIFRGGRDFQALLLDPTYLKLNEGQRTEMRFALADQFMAEEVAYDYFETGDTVIMVVADPGAEGKGIEEFSESFLRFKPYRALPSIARSETESILTSCFRLAITFVMQDQDLLQLRASQLYKALPARHQQITEFTFNSFEVAKLAIVAAPVDQGVDLEQLSDQQMLERQADLLDSLNHHDLYLQLSPEGQKLARGYIKRL